MVDRGQAPVARRQHTIPRMLLKRFASRIEGREAYTWQFRRRARPFETNVRNASVESMFYGDSDNGIEQGLSSIESRHAFILDEVSRGRAPGGFADDLRQLLWTLGVRTSNFRRNVGDLFRHGIDEMAEQVDAPTAKMMISDHLKSEFDTMLDDTIGKLPAVQARAFRISLERRPALRDKFRRVVSMLAEAEDYALAFKAVLHMARRSFDMNDVSRTAHIRSLLRLSECGYVPESFRPEHWQILRAASGHVILGDSASFAIDGDASPGHVLRFGQDWLEIYLPISHDAVLVASRTNSPPQLTIEQINTASASLSYDQFFAAENSLKQQTLLPLIRTKSATLSREEMQEIVRNMLSGHSPERGDEPAT